MNGRSHPINSVPADRNSTRESDGVIERHPLPHGRAQLNRGPPPPLPTGPFDVSASPSSSPSSSASGTVARNAPFQNRSQPRKPTTRGAGNINTGLQFPMADSLGVNGGSKNKHALNNGAGGAPASSTGANLGPGNNYQSMHTPIESKKKSPRVPPTTDIQSQRERIDESSEDSFDNGSYASEKPMGPNGDGAGWFHAKIKVDNSIHWANNYKIQLLMFLMLVSGAAVTIKFATNSADMSVGIVCGSIITIISCTSVVYTFLTRPSWRKHPNPIIFFRSLCDIGLVSVLLVTEIYKCGTGDCLTKLGQTSCSTTAGLTQFFLWSSESWFFVMAIDMLFSLQSPFTDYKRNVRRYHMFVWITGTLGMHGIAL